MSSHQEWEKFVIEAHDLEKPFAPENGQPLQFVAGDWVTYKNDAGCTFLRRITGLYQPKQPCSLYATGARYLLDWNCYWMPVVESKLTFYAKTEETT